MRIAFAGTPQPAAQILVGLLGGHHEVPLVISQPDKPRGRRGTPTPTPVAQAALDAGIDCLRVSSINDEAVLDRLCSERVGALVVVAFGQLLKEPLLSEWLCINVHFSLLPAYRGAAPVERAVMDGVSETGVTIMRMDAGLDTGPMVRTAVTPVDMSDDAGAVMERLCGLAVPALVATLDDIAGGVFRTTDQPSSGATHAAKIGPDDRTLEWSGTAAAVVNRVRALSPHIGAQCRVGGEPFKVWRARLTDDVVAVGKTLAADGRLVVGCADGAVEILELQPPGRSRMSAGDFLRGWRGGIEVSV